MNMTNEELRKMEEFYLKELFENIPAIDIEFKKPDCRFDAMGLFDMQMNDDYCCLDDDLYCEYDGYKSLEGYGFAVGVNDRDLPWMDVLNHPKLKIQIAPDLKEDKEMLVITLIHELCHYYCWYVGLDHHDKDEQFLGELKKLGIPSNYDFEWINKKWVRPEIFRENARKYIEMYERRAVA
ncbi:hypothetical protein bpr_II095 (plasmid) [Butyrivibrio proteoclasticus B316]|uniref:Uncharacterized protein n=1 Tax=Butyrivibrio proteoclasticus (strain ATCC 51982 / DSM 14932 / B316) TaxID=515622 RepID=E0S3Q2_BUTPB|nr:hypothetical protein [Butyrivibrio proteoclasticus]ADL36034.1 hypothetical protein bpr_II095 [Butyrivibrio proteoclasticus B316]